MNHKAAITVLVAGALALVSADGFAQGQGQGQGPPQQQGQQQQGQSQKQGQAQQQAQKQKQKQSGDHGIYGGQLMTEQERSQYHEQIQTARTDEERRQIQAEHREQILARAHAQGVDLVPPGQGPIYGGNLMTVQERNEYRDRLWNTQTEEEKNALIAKHREEMQMRAMQQGVEPEAGENDR